MRVGSEYAKQQVAVAVPESHGAPSGYQPSTSFSFSTPEAADRPCFGLATGMLDTFSSLQAWSWCLSGDTQPHL